MPATICEPPSTAAPGTTRFWCAAAGFLLLSTLPAAAGSMESVSLYEQYKALSNDPKYKWAGAVTLRTIEGVDYTASCVAVAPTVVIGAAHFTPSPTGTSIITTVTFGSNYRTGERLMMEVERWERFPGYVSGDPSTIDLGVYYLKQPIPGFTPVAFAPESPALGTILTMVDYGNYGDTTTGELPSLGDRLAGRAVVSNTFQAVTTYPVAKYALVNFHIPQGDPIVSYRTQGLQLSSGSPWFDENGHLAFLSVAAPIGAMDLYTICLRLNLPEVQAWLQPKIAASWAAVSPPELTSAITAGQLRVTWDSAATGWTLHASDTLGSWTPLGPALTGPGFYEEPLATRRFFRLQRP